MLLFFSCAGKPASKAEGIDSTPSESVEPVDESENIEDEIITDEIAELESEDVQTDYIEEQIDDNEELTEVISDGPETAVLNEQPEEVPAPVEETPPVEIAVQIPPPLPPEPALPPAPPPPEPAQPQMPPVRQPPVPPPALLGPAEENPPSQRETVPPSSEPRSEPRVEPRVEPRSEPRVEPRSEPRVEPRIEPRSEPRIETPAPVTGSEPPIRPVVTPQSDGIVFSRIVRATVGQIIEIPFVGNGWIYMGELASRRGIVYSSTRRDPEGQSIIFGAEAAGTYVLRFYKDNFLTGYKINDYVQVIVGEAPTTGGAGWFAPPYDRGRVVALPRWPSALDVQQRDNEQRGSFSADDLRLSQTPVETDGSRTAVDTPPAGTVVREPASQGASPSQGTTASQGTISSQGTPASQGTMSSQGTSPSQGTAAVTEPAAGAAPERLAPEAILQRAGETFTGGNVPAAIALLDQFRENYPSGSDELYWLYGQFYEANSPSRNILLSLDYYRRLVNEYPQSSRYNDARRRIAYLERFYINIQ